MSPSPSPSDSELAASLSELARDGQGPLLAVDASAAIGSIAAVGPAGCVERTLDSRALPSDVLVSAIEASLTAVGAKASELAAIVVGIGPGSFTGLRVALATVKGMAYGGSVPVYGVSSLALIAAGVGPGLVAPVLDARRGEVFCALYEVSPGLVPHAIIEDGSRTPAAFAELLATHARSNPCLVGDGSQLAELAAFANPAPILTATPRAAAGLLLAGGRILHRDADNLATLSPRYLRVSEAERQLQARQN